MKSYFTRFAVAALLNAAPVLPGYAEDAAAPMAPAVTQTEAPPPSVPRPSPVPKTSADKTAEPDANSVSDARHRHYAHRHVRRYRTAYWEPFPIYWPHLYRHRIQWNRVPWTFRF